MHARTVLAPLASTALVLAASVAPAFAGPPVQHETFTDDYAFPECGGAYLVEGSFTDRIIVRDTNPSLGGEFFRLSNRYAFSETITNLATGDFVSVSAHGNFIELQPSSTDSRIFDFITHDTGNLTVQDSAGNVVLREVGLFQFSYTFDSLGDAEPGGDFIRFEDDLRTAGPHPTFDEDFDFCAFLDEVTG